MHSVATMTDQRKPTRPAQTERGLPQNLDAERATVGAIFLDRFAIVPVSAFLEPTHFAHQKLAWIYEAQLACLEQRIPPDMTTVADELRRQERLDEVGGLGFLVDLSNSAPVAVHVEYYAEIVYRAFRRRQLIAAGGKIAALGFDETLDDELMRAQADQLLTGALGSRTDQDGAPLSTLVDQYYRFLERVQEDKAAGRPISPIGIATGWLDFDRLTGGVHNSDLIVVAARPGVGKSALALSLAWQVAQRHGTPTQFFALEMGRDQLLHRLLAMHSGVDSQRLRSGAVSEEELPHVLEAMGQLSTLPIYIEDTPGLTVAALKAKLRRQQAERGIGLVIVDYLQLMQGGQTGRRNDNRQEEVAHIVRSLKLMARELNVPIIALSQLSRAVEGRTSHVPALADLRESGEIENAADIVIGLYREEMYDKDTDKKGVAELHFLKHRNGPTGTVSLFYDQRTTRFHTLAPYSTPEGY